MGVSLLVEIWVERFGIGILIRKNMIICMISVMVV